MRLPEAFLQEMKELLGAEYPAWLACLDAAQRKGLRVNQAKLAPEDFAARGVFSLRRVPWAENGYYLDGEERASRHPYYAAGLYYLQEPSAMTPAACLPVEPGDLVLDLCAAPGGKATEIAAKLRGTGLLVANDVSPSRAQALLRNLELFGAGNILVTGETPEHLLRQFGGWFDKILVDAPCSGEGMFRKNPAMAADWEAKGPAFYAAIQREIVSFAAQLLRPGGLLLYSTCTFSVQENEETLLTLLRAKPGFRLLPLPLSREACGFGEGRPDLVQPGRVSGGAPLTREEAENLKLAARLYPHRLAGEGHFVALLQKDGAGAEACGCEVRATEAAVEGRRSAKARGRAPEKTALPLPWQDFAAHLRLTKEREARWERAAFYQKDGRLYLLPEALRDMPLRGLRCLRTGLLLGEVKGKRFEPSQALAMYLRKEEFDAALDFAAADARVIRYLKGETVDVPDFPAGSGWRLICVDGFPLGWGKQNGDTLKNKYCVGWRWL